MVEIASETAVWYSTGLPAVPVRWVLIRDPQKEFKTQALLCTEPQGRSAEDPLLVCDTLAAGGELPGGTSASRIRDAEAVVGSGDTADYTGTLTAILAGHLVCASPDDTGVWCFPAGGLVPQELLSDLRRRFGAGAKGVVGSGDFLRLALEDRHRKSTAGAHRALDRCALLCSLMAKVEQRIRIKRGGRAIVRYSSTHEKTLPNRSIR
jgi:hypothetical protein